jgi:hypothetical protein
MSDERPQRPGLPVGCGCALGIANAVFVWFVAMGIGFGSRPMRGHEPAFLDMPISMLWPSLVVIVPGPLAVWWIFHRRGYSALGAVLAFIGVLAFFGLMREATMVVP